MNHFMLSICLSNSYRVHWVDLQDNRTNEKEKAESLYQEVIGARSGEAQSKLDKQLTSFHSAIHLIGLSIVAYGRLQLLKRRNQ